MNVLVTGATGFVGAHLCQALAARGDTVRAFHRSTSNLRLLDGLAVEHVLGDLTQPETIEPALAGVEVVFHAAAWMGDSQQPGKLYAVTVEGTRSLLQAAQAAGVRRVVHTSSVAALGAPPPGAPALINENHTWNLPPDHYPYGYAKYLAELEVQKAVARGLDVVITNPSLVFGPGDIYRQSSSLINQVAQRRITVSMEGGINCVHIADVVAGHLAALERGQCGQRYILGGQNLTFLQLLNTIAEVVGVPGPNLVLPGRLLRAGARPLQLMHSFLDLPIAPELLRMAGRYFYFDLRKAENELGLSEHRPVRQAIEDAYAWFHPKTA